MRIISGTLKNKKLIFQKSINTRPLKDSVRENIFNILFHSKNIEVNLKNSIVLDLYAGTGSFGFECVSRGSSKVVFVEKNAEAIKILNTNTKNLKCENKIILFQKSVKDFYPKSSKNKFDIIFFDPPYENKEFIEIIKLIQKERTFLKKKHLIIIHRELKTEDNIDQYLNVLEKRIYGRSKIYFGKFILWQIFSR